MPALRNDFSWSHSRAEAFVRCPRRYWFQYYGMWGGWERAADPRTRTIYILNKLTSRQAWMGTTVHNCLQWVLTTLRTEGQAPAEEDVLRLLGRRINKDFESSGEGLYWDDPKTYRGLLEHEYEEREIPDEEWKELFERTLMCVTNFYQSEVFRQLQALPSNAWLEVEERSSIDVDGFKVWAQLDCAHRSADGIVIYDWKTGKADQASTRTQLAGYVLYAVQRWGVRPEQVTAREFNLPQSSLHETRLDEAQLAEARAAMVSSASALRELHGAEEARFPFTETESRCAKCNFTRICPRFASAE